MGFSTSPNGTVRIKTYSTKKKKFEKVYLHVYVLCIAADHHIAGLWVVRPCTGVKATSSSQCLNYRGERKTWALDSPNGCNDGSGRGNEEAAILMLPAVSCPGGSIAAWKIVGTTASGQLGGLWEGFSFHRRSRLVNSNPGHPCGNKRELQSWSKLSAPDLLPPTSLSSFDKLEANKRVVLVLTQFCWGLLEA